MKYLLDVNVLLAAIWNTHAQHAQAFAWIGDKEIVLCPVAEMGFLRISTNLRAIGAPMSKAREALEKLATEAERIDDDLNPLHSHPKSSEEVTDHYLANLAAKHGFKLATFDQQLAHPAVELVC